MKKRALALGIVLIACLSACGKQVETISTTGTLNPVEPTVTVAQSYTREEIEAHLAEIGETYDGIYKYDEDEGMSSALNMFTMNADVGSAGAVADGFSFSDLGASGWGEPAEAVDWNTEGYNYINENGFTSVATQPFSTFGADVDTATYSNFRHDIFEDSTNPIPADAIRIEEMVNYFSYNYSEPKDGEKFGVSATLCECPWNSDALLLRVGVKAESIPADNGSNIVFLVDTSGSMFDNNKLPLAQKALNILQENLTDKDTISIVTYAGTSDVILEGVKGSQHDEIREAIDSLEARGSTNGEGGIEEAYKIAKKYFVDGGNNRVILCTDGDLNVGVSSEAGLIKLVEKKRDSGVFLSCLGFGDGNYQDAKMEALADYGNGNYAYIDCSREAERVLSEELWSTLYTVAKDTKFQIEFNPELVKGYRQIGYENRQMAAEDFADDTKDGGEVGSGQCVTVLYEIITVDSDYEIPSVESKYGNSTGTESTGEFSDELLTINIRYKEPDENTSILTTYAVTKDMITEMDEDTSWAAGVAQVGMILRDSEYKGTSTYKDVYERLINDSRVMTDDYRAEFLYLISLLDD